MTRVADRLSDLLDVDTTEYLSRHPGARAQVALLARLIATTGGVSAVATRCPQCRQDDGLIIRFAAGRLARCVLCGHRTSLVALLRPAPRPGEREQLQRIMAARPRGR